MNDRARSQALQALATQVLDSFPYDAPEPSAEVRAWLEGGAPLPAARPASPWRRFARWFAGLGVAVQSLAGTSVALAVVAGAGAAGVLPPPVQRIVDDATITRAPQEPDAAPVRPELPKSEPVVATVQEAVAAPVLRPSPTRVGTDDDRDERAGREDRAEVAADDAEDREEERRDRAEDRAEDRADAAEDAADEAEDAADEAEDAEDDAKDAAEDAADDAEDEAEEERDRERDRRDR